MKRSWFASPYVIWSIMFTIVPLLMIGYYAFTDSSGAFTLANFQRFFRPTILGVLKQSLWMALLCTVLCLVIAYPAALFLTGKDFERHQVMVVLIILPMWMNFLLRTRAWVTILGNTGVINTLLGFLGIEPLKMLNTEGAVVLGMVYNYLPYMILPLYSVMVKIDQSVLEAADDLGCNYMTKLFRVIVPLSLPGITSGITMVFVPAISTFIISRMLGGGSNLLIGDLIEMQFLGNAYNPQLGAAISLVLMVIILLIMTIMNQFDPDDQVLM